VPLLPDQELGGAVAVEVVHHRGLACGPDRGGGGGARGHHDRAPQAPQPAALGDPEAVAGVPPGRLRRQRVLAAGEAAGGQLRHHEGGLRWGLGGAAGRRDELVDPVAVDIGQADLGDGAGQGEQQGPGGHGLTPPPQEPVQA
jgi:hypothetical protein